ncbi:MAG: hypothetical protein IJM24_10065 [Clostridia bacterium]|nr:hypothetical protein [Clostridia bacterium]
MKKSWLKVLIIGLLATVIAAGAACGSRTENSTPADDEEPTEAPTATPVPRDITGDTPLARSIVYANDLANKVNGWYESYKRDTYVLQNMDMELSHKLAGDGGKGLSSFRNRNGAEYFSDSFDTYVIDTDGREWTDRYSLGTGRVNTTRLGYYYYETHVRDLGVGAAGTDSNYESAVELANFSKTWEAHDGSVDADAKKGRAVFTVGSAYDPYFVVKAYDQVPGANFNSIEITLSVDGSASSVEMFISDGQGYNQKQSTKFSVNADGMAHTYLIDTSAIQSGGALSGVRFDIGENVGEKITVTSVRAVKTSSSVPRVKTEKTYHTFSDKLHQQFRIVAYDKIDNIAEFGMVWKVDKERVDALRIKDRNGSHDGIDGIDPASVEYVAFDFKDAGVCGIIVPADAELTKEVTVTESGGQYVVRQKYPGSLVLKNKATVSVAHRLYNDTTHSFDNIDRAAYLERHPLDGERFHVEKNDSNTRFSEYDAIRGLYVFTLKGSDFNTAYMERNRNKYFGAAITVDNDNCDRRIYLNFSAKSECLECGALLDGNGLPAPIPMEVCKNFTYEKEEPVYDPTDVPYAETFFPLRLVAGEQLDFTQLHLYMNWGKYPLKQLSSIQFHVSYYHLSTGVTESNCIAPYYVYGRDGWTLPDFRGPSGIMWANQPQFTAGGHNKFVSYKKSGSTVINRAEYTRSFIRSYGPIYADLEYSYKADSGEYQYTLRHMEFPQTDENRTYYTLSLKFLKDFTLDDVRNEFTLHYFDGRDQKFDKLSYTAEDGTVKTVVTDFSKANTNTVKLAADRFWYAYYGSSNQDCMNEAFVLKKYDIMLNGERWDGGFVLRNGYDGQMYNISELSLDLGKYTFKKGDTIYLEFMLVPWGNTDHDTYENIERIFEDSVLKPIKVDVSKGTLLEEPFLPHVLCADNSAEFTVSGGRNNIAVRVDGFTVFAAPFIETKQPDGSWAVLDNSVKGFDGYAVQYLPDGTYAYSFVFTQANPDDSVTFRVSAGA